MSEQRLARILLTAGVLMLLLALSADSIGLGASPGIGLKQIALALVGVIAAAAGISKLRNRG